MIALAVTGAAIFVLLGLAHAVLTLKSVPTHGAFAASNPEVQRAMQAPTGLGLAPDLDTTLWRAWIGFNLSHALGVLAVGGVILFHAIDDLAVVADQPWFLVLSIGTPAVYLMLSIRYWFEAPTRAIAVGWVLSTVGTLGTALG